MTSHAHLACSALVSALLLAAAAPCSAQPPRGPEVRALDRALKLLPQRPTVPIRLIDPELAADPGAVRRLDAFLIRDSDGRVRSVIYLNQRSALVQKALSGGRFDLAVLAAVIRHEQEHLRGGTELEARQVELTFFQSLIRDGQVASDQGLAYLKQLTQQYRHQ